MTDADRVILKQIFVTQPETLEKSVDPLAILDVIYNTSAEDIFGVICENKDQLPAIKTNNIPQFSNADDLFSVLRIIIDSGMEDLTYEKIGYFMCPQGAKVGAKTKYGENHYKLAVQLGLAKAEKPFAATEFGVAFYITDDEEKQTNVKKKLSLRVPIIQQALLSADSEMIDMEEFMEQYLAHSTMLRRRSNVRELVSFIMDVADTRMQHRINNLLWGA